MLRPCLRCGNQDIEVEEWYCGDNSVPFFRYGCKNGHTWDEWFDTKEEAENAWNEIPEE